MRKYEAQKDQDQKKDRRQREYKRYETESPSLLLRRREAEEPDRAYQRNDWYKKQEQERWIGKNIRDYEEEISS